MDTGVSARLTRFVEKVFGPGLAEMVLLELAALPGQPGSVTGGQDLERIQASVVLRTDGEWDTFQRRLSLLRQDWRDALVSAGLGNVDWPQRLDAVLGPR